jgi:hypothetical protein
MKPKRPRDTNQLAKMITDLTTRMTKEADPKKKNAKSIGKSRKGGSAQRERSGA